MRRQGRLRKCHFKIRHHHRAGHRLPLFKSLLEEKYGKEGAKERIFCTTDKARGTLKALADSEGYETFVVPDDVGGRYSVLTAVGLLPSAVSWAPDIRRYDEGCKGRKRGL